jgi:hypothetical protein
MNVIQYSKVYNELVKDNGDAVGMFAYALYKQQKIAFIAQIHSEKNQAPTPEELVSFHTLSMLEPTIKGYREQAEILVSAFLTASLTQRVEEIQSSVEESVIGERLKEIKEDINSKRTWQGWFADVASNLTVNVLTIMLIGMLIFGYNGLGQITKKAESIANIPSEDNKQK